MNTIHKKITDMSKKTIESMNIVFPAQYGKIYADFAKDHNIELKAEEILNREMLDDKMVRHIVLLSEYTNQALDAMVTNNSEKLKKVIEETDKLKHEIEELKKVVYEDPLTKSYNRKWFEDNYLSHHNHLHLRGEGTLMLIDLNNFKDINDTYGHLVGDKVLSYVASKLTETGGRVVRYGGDEFLIIFDSKITLSQITKKIDTLQRFWDKTSFKSDKHSFKISFAYGTAAFTSGSNAEEVISKADQAMYKGKKGEK
jgi:diguanylate cyclase (GGDEF)-like protein